MAEELGRIEKPEAEKYREGRKLFFVPLVYSGEELPADYLIIYNRYWEQVGRQIGELEGKLGAAQRIYHELVPAAGEDGCRVVKDLNERAYQVVQTCLGNGAVLEALEDAEVLAEFMDWSRCLMLGLQNPDVIKKVYDAFTEASRKRDERLIARIDGSLKANEIGILLMREKHQVQFPADIQVFYVAPPALDEMKRWLRQQEKPEKSE